MKYLAVHHTTVHTTGPQLYAVDKYHKGKWNMKSALGWYVGYNFFIDVDGTITNTRKVGEETVAQIGHNCTNELDCDTISVCLAGNFDVYMPNEKQITALQTLRQQFPTLEITMHRALQTNRTCPGKNITIDYLNYIIDGTVVHPDDAEKAKIKELTSILDTLRSIYAKLLASKK